jgi:Sulfatase
MAIRPGDGPAAINHVVLNDVQQDPHTAPGGAGNDHVAAVGERSPQRARPWRALVVDAAVLVGLAGVAITQPILDLFGRNPTFFVAGGYGRRQIVAFALTIAFVPGLVAFVLSAVPGLVDRRLGAWLHGGAVAGFAGLFGLAVCRTVGVDALVPALLVAVVVSVGVAVAEWRMRWVRQFLSYLAVGNVAFVVLFLVTSPSAELLTGVSYADAGNVRIPPLAGPVVVVVLDEFPLTSILRADGSINDVRYPNFAALARESTWFRNAASESNSTPLSVPTILTGQLSDHDDLPFLRDHPRNLFTLFGARYPVTRYEAVTDLCPPDICARPVGGPLRQALEDASVVYRHRVLPEALRDGLPDIDSTWGNFGDSIGGDAPVPETTLPTTSTGEPDRFAKMYAAPKSDGGRVGQARALRRQIDLIGADPSLHFIHVLQPHHPYQLTPWGGVNTDTWNPAAVPQKPSDPGYEFIFRELRGLQALQLAVADQNIGHLVDRLKALGAWEEATVVITSDHGVDVSPPNFSRNPTPETIDEVMRIPLFIKAPGQEKGEVRDNPASTLDVLPSLVDLLGIDTGWRFDGHSLFDDSEPKIDSMVTSDVEAAFEVAARAAALFPRGESWDDLAAVGEAEDLVGRSVKEFEVGAPSDLSVSFGRRDLLANLSVDSGPVPYSLRGVLRGSHSSPPELAVALNGTFAGTIGGYRPDGDAWKFSGLMANYFANGANDVVAYQVERQGTQITLHEVRSG